MTDNHSSPDFLSRVLRPSSLVCAIASASTRPSGSPTPRGKSRTQKRSLSFPSLSSPPERVSNRPRHTWPSRSKASSEILRCCLSRNYELIPVHIGNDMLQGDDRANAAAKPLARSKSNHTACSYSKWFLRLRADASGLNSCERTAKSVRFAVSSFSCRFAQGNDYSPAYGQSHTMPTGYC